MTNNSNLFALANQIKKERGISQKEAFAEAKKQLAEATAQEVSTPAPAKKGQGRGIYERTEKWKADHAEKMRQAWAKRKANGSFVPKAKSVSADAEVAKAA